jgi:hypothetical protein
VNRPFWGGVAAGVLAMACTGFLFFREPIARSLETPSAAGAATPARPASSEQDQGIAKRSSAANPLRPVARMLLPPPNTPLAGVFPELVRAARSGDPGAMCRLAFEMARCGPTLERYRRMEAMYTDLLVYDEPDEQRRGNLLQMLARNTAKREELDSICVGVELPRDLAPWRLLRDAARGGHVPSMLRFAVEFPVDFENLLDDVDGLVAYRDEQFQFLERAAAAGNAKAAHSLFWAYAGEGGMFLAGKPREDPVEALAYALALEGIGNPASRERLQKREAMLRRRLSPARAAQAERRAAELAPRYAGSRGLDVDLRRGLSDTAEDCGATDPTELHISVPKPPRPGA